MNVRVRVRVRVHTPCVCIHVCTCMCTHLVLPCELAAGVLCHRIYEIRHTGDDAIIGAVQVDDVHLGLACGKCREDCVGEHAYGYVAVACDGLC